MNKEFWLGKLKIFLVVFFIIDQIFVGWPNTWNDLPLPLNIKSAQAAATTAGTTWFLRDTTASAAFSTTGPTQEYAAASDATAAAPTNKTTALAMTDTPGTAQVTITGATSGLTWFRTFLSPKLAAQTIAAGTTFSVNLGAKETSGSANAYTRIHIYVWRQGTGNIATLVDGSGANCTVATEYTTSEWGYTCYTAGTGGGQAILAGDQIAAEIWVQAVTGYSQSIFYGGATFLAHATANTNAMATFGVSNALTLQSATLNATTWFLRATTASAAFSTTGPTQEYAAASDATAAVPTNKTTALAMTDTPGTGDQQIGGLTSGLTWFRTFLSPKLAAQTIAAGTVFSVNTDVFESGTSANAYTRLHVYVWRQGTGNIATLVDGSGANCTIATEYTSGSITGRLCYTAGTAGAQAILSGDQIAAEIWVQAATGYTERIYYDGVGFVAQATANTLSSRATFGSSKVLALNNAPTLAISEPNGTSDTVTIGDSYNITYALADTDDTVTAAFYYDTNMDRANGTAITGACATAAAAATTCAWDTTGVAAGNYYVYGVTTDSVNDPVSAISPGQITINAAAGPSITAPASVNMLGYTLGGVGYSERNFSNVSAYVSVTASAGFTVTVISSDFTGSNNNIASSNVKLKTNGNTNSDPTLIINCSGFSGVAEPAANEYALNTAQTIASATSGSGTCDIYPTIRVYIANSNYAEVDSGTLTFTVTQ